MKFSSTLLIVLATMCLPLFAQQQKITIEQQVGDNINKQIMCIAKNIYYEAASESHEGKLAVAQVTINRANSKKYPSDFCGVVYQKTGSTCQFSWTCEKVNPSRTLMLGKNHSILPNEHLPKMYCTESLPKVKQCSTMQPMLIQVGRLK